MHERHDAAASVEAKANENQCHDLQHAAKTVAGFHFDVKYLND